MPRLAMKLFLSSFMQRMSLFCVLLAFEVYFIEIFCGSLPVFVFFFIIALGPEKNCVDSQIIQ